MEVRILDYGTPTILAENLAGAEARAIDMRPVGEEIATDMLRIEKMVFQRSGARGGSRWKSLAESTIRKKGSTKILRDTYDLMRSVSERGAAHQILKVDKNSVELGTDRPWAFVHQYGSKGFSKTPARPFMRLLPQDEIRWRGMILDYLTETLKRPTI